MSIDIRKFDETEWVDLNRRIVARLKYLQEARTYHQMLSFDVGDCVRFQPPGHDPKTWVIIKHNHKTVTVVTDDHHQWNVALVFLSRVVGETQGAGSKQARVVQLPAKR